MIEQLSQVLVELISDVGAFGIFAATFIESLFPPIPSEIVLFSAGFYAESINSPLLILLYSIVGALGNFFGTLPFYFLAKKSEKHLLNIIDKYGAILLITRGQIQKAEKYFRNHGQITIFLARLIPGIRSLIAIPAGLSRVNLKLFAFFSIIGSTLWNLVLTTLGYLAYDQKEKIFKVISPFEDILVYGTLVIIVIYFLRILLEIFKLSRRKEQ